MSAPAHESPSDERLLVAAGSRFQGLMGFRGAARVDGELEGDVVASGSLILGESASLRGHVEVDELVVSGTLQGSATVRRRLEIRSGARVEAEIQAPLISVEEGSVLQGRCQMRTGTDSAGPPPVSPAPDSCR